MRTEQFPPRSADFRDIGHLDVRHAAVSEADDGLNVVFVGNVVPDEVRLVKPGDVNHRCLDDVEQPIEVVRAPVIELPARDGFHATPPIRIRFSVSTTPHLDIENFANNASLHQFAERPKICIPTPVVMHG